MRRLAIALVAVAGVSGVAAAQPAQPPDAEIAPPPAETAPPPLVPVPAADARADAGWSLYHRSFSALATGDRATARALVRQLGREQPAHEAVALLRADGFGPDMVDEPAPGSVVERPAKGARAELALFQAFHGMMVGIDVDLMAQPDDAFALLALPLVGTLAGILASVEIGDITPGTRALANSGTAWGELETAFVLGALPGSVSAREIGGALLVGSVGGLVVGGSLAKLDITEGQVALANSGGIWTGAATLLTLEVLHLDSAHSTQHFCEAVIGSTAAGLIGGAYLAKLYPETTRSHTLVIDAGGIAGGVVGLALGAIAINGIHDDQVNAGLSLGGMLIGLGGAIYLTRNWDASPSVLDRIAAAGTPYVAPVERGGGGIAGYAIAW